VCKSVQQEETAQLQPPTRGLSGRERGQGNDLAHFFFTRLAIIADDAGAAAVQM
jgi:hypothetical protein